MTATAYTELTCLLRDFVIEATPPVTTTAYIELTCGYRDFVVEA